MHARERVADRFVEDPDQVDDGRHVRHETCERGRIVDITFDNVYRRKQDQMARSHDQRVGTTTSHPARTRS
jgi:hypothetical protein